jgi:hypothetical protein
VKLDIVTLEIKGQPAEFVLWAKAHASPGCEYALLVPKPLFIEMAKATGTDLSIFYKTILLYEIQGESYVYVEDDKKKQEVFNAVVRGSKT